MHARVITLHVMEGSLDQVLRIVQQTILPTTESQPGFVGVVVLGHWDEGKVVGTSYWNTEEEMLASERGEYLQQQISRVITFLSKPPIVEHYQVYTFT